MKITTQKTNSAKMATLKDFLIDSTDFQTLENVSSFKDENGNEIVYSSAIDIDHNIILLNIDAMGANGHSQQNSVVIDIEKELQGLQDKQALLINIPTQALKTLVNTMGSEGIQFESNIWNETESLTSQFIEVNDIIFKIELTPTKMPERYYLKLFRLSQNIQASDIMGI